MKDFNVTLNSIEYGHFIDNDIPVSAYLAILCVIGTFGNTHAVFVYFLRYNPSNYRTFVVWLASIDLIACVFSIPFELFDIRYSCTFTADGVCRLFRYLNHFVSICSGSLLGVIAVERYQKVCRPFGKQLKGSGAMIACMITVGVSAIISMPAIEMYGVTTEKIDNYNINGTDCKVLHTYKDSFTFKGFNLGLLVISTTVFVICLVIYIRIGRVLYQQHQFRVQLKKRIRTSETQILSPVAARPAKDGGRQITFVFLIATGVSYLGYLPYLILTIFRSVIKDSGRIIILAIGPFSDILLRGYFISNVTNPVVFCFLDVKFRKECKEMYSKLFRTVCKKCNRNKNI